MTLNTMGRRAAKASIASMLSVAMGLGLTACGNNHTVAFLYATTAKNNPGVISGYKVDFQAGHLVQLAMKVAGDESLGCSFEIGLVTNANRILEYASYGRSNRMVDG